MLVYDDYFKGRERKSEMHDIFFPRFCLDSDDDGHWYVIPVNRRKDWERFVNEGEGELPMWATEVGGHPNRVTFTDPKVGL